MLCCRAKVYPGRAGTPWKRNFACVCVTGRRDGARGRGTRRGRATDTAGSRAVECVCYGSTRRGTRTGQQTDTAGATRSR
eukprot:997428-Prymnesium_polylepis.1